MIILVQRAVAGKPILQAMRVAETWRYEEEGETGLLDRRLGKASASGSQSTGPRRWSGFIASATRGFTVKHFHERLVKGHGFGWGYAWLKLHLQWKGVVGKRAAQRRAPEEARAAAPAGDDAASGRFASRLARWPAPARPHPRIKSGDDDGRRTGRSTRRSSPRRKARQPSLALKEVFGLPMSLYTNRGAHYFHTPKAGGEVDRGHLTQVGLGPRATRRRAHRGLFTAGAGPFGARVRQASGSSGHRARARWPKRYRRGGRLHWRGLRARSQRPLRHPAPGEGSPSRPFLASISTRSYTSRRSARSAMTIASPTGRSSPRSRKARCAPISSGPGQDPRLRRRLARPLQRAALHRPLRRAG